MTTLIKPQKFYEHGDEDEALLGTFYCVACDVFLEASHLGGDPDDPIDVRRHLEAAERAEVRCQRMFQGL